MRLSAASFRNSVCFLALALAVVASATVRADSAPAPHSMFAATVAPGYPAPSALPAIGIEGRDDRVVADSAAWPWVAIGRLNRSIGGHCSAALIGARQVLTAAHCLYNDETGRWILPAETHFVAGYRQGGYAGHAVAARFTIAPGYDPRHATDPKQMARDWAIIELAQPLSIKPIPLSSRSLRAMLSAARSGEMNVAGYAADRGEVLMRHKGCQLLGQAPDVALLVHRCDVTYGVSGAPLLLLEGGTAEIIGIHNAVADTQRGIVATAVPVAAFASGVTAALSAR